MSLAALVSETRAQGKLIAGPAGSVQFGTTVTVLKNGNVVVTDPSWSGAGLTNAGAVHLYDGKTMTLISSLRGSQNRDSVGCGGIVELASGNFVVLSPYWHSPLFRLDRVGRGAVTFVNSNTGLNDSVHAANSLVGWNFDDLVGSGGVYALKNGNYVVLSPMNFQSLRTGWASGAVTWGDGRTGVSGVVDPTNSLIGFKQTPYSWGYNAASLRLTELTNGNYVIQSDWDTLTMIRAGAVTWCNGAAATIGPVHSGNSLTGSQNNDRVGELGIVPLTNGNYVVNSGYWSNGSAISTGASTWCDGARGRTGHINRSNSIVGQSQYEYAGVSIALMNGNYVVASTAWNNNRGAVRLCNGTTGDTGVFSVSNSLCGAQPFDQVGSGILPLTNGNFVVLSKFWNGGTGAATWVDGSLGLISTVSTANSLIGNTTYSSVGTSAFALKNGSYLIQAGGRGALSFGNGIAPLVGSIDSSNSLVGDVTNDFLGARVLALDNGNAVITTSLWAARTGAVTWCDGMKGVYGRIDSNKSLIGTFPGQLLGASGAVALTNGNYVVSANNYGGSVTWGDGKLGVRGTVNATNSLVNTFPQERLGSGVLPLDNGHYIVSAPNWTRGPGTGVGAMRWCDGFRSTAGSLDESNSFLTNAWMLANRDSSYIVVSPYHSAAGNFSGAVTWTNGGTRLTGNVNSCNSFLGPAPDLGPKFVLAYHGQSKYILIGTPARNEVHLFNPRRQQLALHLDSSQHDIESPAGAGIPFVDTSVCRLIASVLPAGNTQIAGKTRALNYLWPAAQHFAGKTYVRRHIDLQTARVDDTGSHRLTLYFEQSDFTDYNTADSIFTDLPAQAGDTTGIAALRIVQEFGVSSSGMPGSYITSRSVPLQIHNPADSNVVWNAVESRWEVTLDVRGGGGFFALTTTTAPLHASGEMGRQNGISVSPNPTRSKVAISITHPEPRMREYRICDITGRSIRSGSLLNSVAVSLSGEPAGLYLVQVSGFAPVKIQVL